MGTLSDLILIDDAQKDCVEGGGHYLNYWLEATGDAVVACHVWCRACPQRFVYSRERELELSRDLGRDAPPPMTVEMFFDLKSGLERESSILGRILRGDDGQGK